LASNTRPVGESERFERTTALDFAGESRSKLSGCMNRFLESGTPVSPRGLVILAPARSAVNERVLSDADLETDNLIL
jgi:hypothetical protein